MSRCQSCGRESPTGAAFCLNCGSRLATAAPTAASVPGLPASIACTVCGGPNQPGMNFCRHCGNPMHGGAPPGRAPALSHAPTPIASPPPPPSDPTPPGMGQGPICRRCGGLSAPGYSFCQQCGAPLDNRPAAIAETLAASGPQAAALRAGSPLGGPVGAVPMGVVPGGGASGERRAAASAVPASDRRPTPFGGHGTPLPASHSQPIPDTAPVIRSGPIVSTTPGAGAPPARRSVEPRGAVWGTLISVRRDGSDGERYPLSGEYVELGREGDLSFDDRYLASRHARLERTSGGVRVVALDTLNGVFRRVRGSEPVTSGTILLVGRELLRLDLVGDEERDVVPLTRHGVMLFGSPPRRPWGRVTQMLSNAGVRDIRHLYGAEVVLGREEGELVFRDDEFLSRRHAALRWNGTACNVEDLKSSNGTFVRLRGATPLSPGDSLRLGDQMFRFEPGG